MKIKVNQRKLAQLLTTEPEDKQIILKAMQNYNGWEGICSCLNDNPCMKYLADCCHCCDESDPCTDCADAQPDAVASGMPTSGWCNGNATLENWPGSTVITETTCSWYWEGKFPSFLYPRLYLTYTIASDSWYAIFEATSFGLYQGPCDVECVDGVLTGTLTLPGTNGLFYPFFEGGSDDDDCTPYTATIELG